MNQVTNQSIINPSNNYEKRITDNDKIDRKQINKNNLLNKENNKILYLNEEKNHYGICKSDYSDTLYLFKRDNTKLEKDKALKFIEDYFDVFIYFFNQEKTDNFFEYTAQINSDNDVIIIKTFKENRNNKKYIKKKEWFTVK